ncbi:MAG: thiamine pyrophosphate-dependent dehydrogenase E1 component subunit alpha [Thermoleophilia bacterium]
MSTVDRVGRDEDATVDERAELLRRAGYWLHLMRAIEEAGRRLYLQGRLAGSFYDGRGQEATAVGAGLALRSRDVACPLIRDLAVHLIRGITPEQAFRHYLGRAGGPMEGRDGNVHLGSLALGTIPMVSHLPEMIPVGMGVALGRAWRGERVAALAFCGDGAANGGVWHEALNLAGAWRAPLVVLVERNGWQYMTRSDACLAVERVVDRAPGYGAAGFSVDGNDVLAVHEVVAAALEHARSGRGPAIVEAHTYRMHGHGSHDDQRYVPQAELAAWAERDPLVLWERRARAEAGWTDEEQRQLVEAVEREVGEALERALAAPYPSPDDLAASVFA